MPDLDLLDVQAWRVYWDEIERRIGAVCARSETCTRVIASLAGLFSPAERKVDTGGEFVAEPAGRFLDDGSATIAIGSLP